MKTTYSFILFICFLVPSLSFAQPSKAELIETILKQLREYPGQSLGYGAAKIYHVYDVSIPANAEIKENANSYVITNVEITMAVSNTYYDITKQTVPYQMTVFKEFKGSHAMGRKNISEIVVLWKKEESTKEFQQTLKALKNLSISSFDELYGQEDDFPAEWKGE